MVEILYKGYAIGIQVLFDRIIKIATSQRHLASALKILREDTIIHRNRLKVSVFLIKKQDFGHKRKRYLKIFELCTSPEHVALSVRPFVRPSGTLPSNFKQNVIYRLMARGEKKGRRKEP